MIPKRRLREEEQVCFRFLEDDEYYKLECIFKEYKGKIPNPKLSKVAIAEIESTGEIIGFFCFQLRPHAEPIWVKEEHRKGKIWIKLAAMLEPLTRKADTFIVADSKEVGMMCEALRLKQIMSPVYVREQQEPLEEGE